MLFRSVTLTISGTNSKGTVTNTYTYTKEEYDLSGCIFFKNSKNWSTVTTYIWKEGSSTIKNAAWPGEKMFECDAENGIYALKMDDSVGYEKVIFSNNGSSQTKNLALGKINYMYDMNTDTWSEYYKEEPKELKLTAKSSASTVETGKSVIITGTASGGSGKYTYSYLIHNTDTGAWSRVTSFTESNTYTWNAGSAGNREFYVEVKDEVGTVVRSSAVVVTTISKNQLTLTAKSSASTVETGKTVTITGTASGGSGSYTYSYLIHNTTTGAWSRVTSFISSNTFIWNAGSAGNREFYVEVKDGAGTVVRSSAVVIKTTAVNQLSLVASTTASKIAVGNSTVIIGTANAGSGDYTYSYLIHNITTGAWSRVTGFIKSNTYTWVAGSVGNREFFVEVKDGAGTVVRSNAVNIVTE